MRTLTLLAADEVNLMQKDLKARKHYFLCTERSSFRYASDVIFFSRKFQIYVRNIHLYYSILLTLKLLPCRKISKENNFEVITIFFLRYNKF